MLLNFHPVPHFLTRCVGHKQEGTKGAVCSDKEGKNPFLSLSDPGEPRDPDLCRQNAVDSLASYSRDVKGTEIMPGGCFAFRPIDLCQLVLYCLHKFFSYLFFTFIFIC